MSVSLITLTVPSGASVTCTGSKKRRARYWSGFHLPPYSIELHDATGQLSLICQKSVPMQRGCSPRHASTAVCIAIACWNCERRSSEGTSLGSRK